MNNCDTCVWATRTGGCASWGCDYIPMKEAAEAWKKERSLIEYIEWLDSLVDSLEETPGDYMEAAKLLQKNRKECAEWLKGKDTFWIVSEKGADDDSKRD